MWLHQRAGPKLVELLLQCLVDEPTWWVEFGVWLMKWVGQEEDDEVCSMHLRFCVVCVAWQQAVDEEHLQLVWVWPEKREGVWSEK